MPTDNSNSVQIRLLKVTFPSSAVWQGSLRGKGFYGLSDMPNEFKQTIDKTLRDPPGECAFLDDVLVCPKGYPEDHTKNGDWLGFPLS